MAVTDLGQAQGMAWARSAGSCFTNSPLAELQEWQGGSKSPVPAPKPVFRGISVEGPSRKVYAIGEKLSLEGLVVKAHLQLLDGSYEDVTVPEKLGAVTDGYELVLDNNYRKLPFTSETIPAAQNDEIELILEISYNGDVRGMDLRWMEPGPAITNIALPTDSYSPNWVEAQEPPHDPELRLIDLPRVTATFEDGTTRSYLSMYSLFDLALPHLIFVESRYEGLEKTLVVIAKREMTNSIKGIVEGHKISGYRYLYGNTQSTATTVSEWLSITPPSN